MSKFLATCFLFVTTVFFHAVLWSPGAWGAESSAVGSAKVVLLVYSAENCPHCQKVEEFVKLMASRHPDLKVEVRDIWNNRTYFEQLLLLSDLFDASVVTPSIFLENRAWFGIGPKQQGQIEEAVQECLKSGCTDTLELAESGRLDPQRGTSPSDESDAGTTRIFVPWVGEVDGRTLSLPLFTLIVGLLDSLNPCAFFVLLFLLSLLIHLRSRPRMLLVGGIFIFFSGLFYFLFMAAWLNLFLSFGQLRGLTLAAGVLAVVMGAVNVKDFFFFKQGVSFSIPDSAKPKLFARMRGLLKASSLISMIGATIVLAAAANMYELLCTAGFPMIFTRVLTLHELVTWEYYLFLVLYNLVYIIPLAVILLIFTFTLGASKLSEWQGRVLKLLSGTMMFMLGTVLVLRPMLLNQMLVSIGLLGTSILITWLVAGVWQRFAHE